MAIGTNQANLMGNDAISVGSKLTNISGASTIILSATSFGSPIAAENVVGLNGSLGAVNYSNSIFGGKNTSGAIGQRSFSWDVTNTGARIGTVDNSFIGYGVKVGINTNQFDSSDP